MPSFVAFSLYAYSLAVSVEARAPKLYGYLKSIKTQMQEHDPSLQWNFSRSVFPMLTANLGPQTVTVPHRDPANLAAGWCTVTALGQFDHTKGGQLVLWDYKLVIDFPAGSTIAFPSALVTHFNVRIRKGETRHSLTQYCSGHLCRFVDNRFKTDRRLRREGRFKRVVRKRRTLNQWMDFFPLVDA